MEEVRAAPEAEEGRRCWEAGASRAKGCWRVEDSEAAGDSGAVAGLQAVVATAAAAVRAKKVMMGYWVVGDVLVAVASPAAVLEAAAGCCWSPLERQCCRCSWSRPPSCRALRCSKQTLECRSLPQRHSPGVPALQHRPANACPQRACSL